MANNFYGAIAHIGGGTGALDAIDGAILKDLDAAFVQVLGVVYFYTLDDDSGVAESSPSVITPDTNAGTKRWVLQKLHVPLLNDPTAPALAFGDGDSGWYERLDDQLSLAIAGVYKARFGSSDFKSATSGGFAQLFAAASATVPAHMFNADEDTGIGKAAADALSLIAGGVEGMRVTEAAGVISIDPKGIVSKTTTAGITASTTQTQGQGALTAQINEVSTVANDDDTITLPTVVAGLEIEVINNGANRLQVFPASGDNLGAGVDTAMKINTTHKIKFVSYDGTNWKIKHITRSLSLRFEAGAVPNTNIDASNVNQATVGYNGAEITDGADIAKSGSDGSFALDASGEVITLDISENIIGFLGSSISALALNSGASTYVIAATINSNNLEFRVRIVGTVANVDWTTILDAGEQIDFVAEIKTAW